MSLRIHAVAAILWVLASAATAEIRRPGCENDGALAPDKRRNGGSSASSPALDRYYDLSKRMRTAFKGPSPETAGPIALDYLAAAREFPCNWDYGNAIHNANIVLGLLALHEGANAGTDARKRAEAVAYLGAAGASPGSPQLDTFGPSLLLARDLARMGETDAVADYLTSIKRFWKAQDDSFTGMLLPTFADKDPIGTWIAQARAGREPSFTMMNMHAP